MQVVSESPPKCAAQLRSLKLEYTPASRTYCPAGDLAASHAEIWAMKGDEFYQQLENDLKNLAAEAKRSDTFTGQLSGLLLLSGPEHPHIREATERSLTKLKTWKEGDLGHTFVIDKVSLC